MARTTIAFGLQDKSVVEKGTHFSPIHPERELVNRLTPQVVEKLGGLPFLASVRRQFIDYQASNGFPNAGEWLWNKPVAIVEPLIRLLILPIVEKGQFLEAFDTS